MTPLLMSIFYLLITMIKKVLSFLVTARKVTKAKDLGLALPGDVDVTQARRSHRVPGVTLPRLHLVL